jgi:hypothetical protein
MFLGVVFYVDLALIFAPRLWIWNQLPILALGKGETMAEESEVS